MNQNTEDMCSLGEISIIKHGSIILSVGHASSVSVGMATMTLGLPTNSSFVVEEACLSVNFFSFLVQAFIFLCPLPTLARSTLFQGNLSIMAPPRVG